uniref:Protein kinase domain-containing protein n=1 Tax=Panagrolaimus sp. PS1159 TaxID=55785 RepID=A0AC35G1D8_9BILA
MNNLRMLTPWDTKNGIVYVDPAAKDSIYFKDIICDSFQCFDILHSTNVQCTREKNKKEIGKIETYCGPLWQKVDEENYFVLSHQLREMDTNYLTFLINDVEIFAENCLAINDTECLATLSPHLMEHFVALPSNYSHWYTFIIVIYVIGTLFIVYFVFKAVISIFRKHRMPFTSGQIYNEVTDLIPNKNNSEEPNTIPNLSSIELRNLITNDYIGENMGHEYSYLLKPPKRPSYVNSQIDESNIKILPNELGHGNSGSVKLAEYKEENITRLVAIKILKNSKASDVLKEIKALCICEHINIIRFIGWTEINNEMCIITEYMSGGDLHSFLQNPSNEVTLYIMFKYIFQTLDGMIYLSSKKILHRDLAARNCLLNENSEILKIGDFGLARKMNDNYIYHCEEDRKLPYRTLPIEVLRGGNFTAKGDIWSFAVLVWEIFERGRTPYDEINVFFILNFLESGSRLTRPKYCSEEL